MSEINFIKTDAGQVIDTILEELENGVGEPLYPGDERRIFGEAMSQAIVTIYNTVNDSCRQRLLRYARGEVLNALGENRSVERYSPTKSVTTLRFGVNNELNMNMIIPAGIRVTGDFVHYFVTDSTVVLYAGDLSVDVTATAENGGAEYNDIAPGGIVNIVDVSEIPFIDYVTNLNPTAGGGDEEGDEQYRERIRQAENKISTAGTAQAYKYWALSANPRVSDAVVETVSKNENKSLKVYAGHAFIGGLGLDIQSLVIYKQDGATVAKIDTDYKVLYADELLTITLFGDLASEDYITAAIDRKEYGHVNIVPICAGGEIPDADVLADVLAVCSSDSVKPLTDFVTVEAPTEHLYDIELTYYTTKSKESEAVQNIEGSDGAIEQYIKWQGAALNRDINPDELKKRILYPHWVEGHVGAERVDIVSPVYTELASTTVAKHSGKLVVNHIVKD